MALPPIGAQPLVFGSKYKWDTDAAFILDTIAQAGYKSIEGGGVADAAEYRRMLDERGLVCTGTHASPKFIAETQKIIDRLGVTGGTDVCNSGLKDWNSRSLADYKETIEILNTAGRKLKDAGMQLHYHHHDFEFLETVEGTGGKCGMDLLIAELDPAVVEICVDVAWVAKGGHDPVEFLLQHKDRVSYLHFKDFNDEGWIELGQGKVDFGAIIKTLENLPRVRWVMIEQDSTKLDPADSARISRAYLRDTFGY